MWEKQIISIGFRLFADGCIFAGWGQEYVAKFLTLPLGVDYYAGASWCGRLYQMAIWAHAYACI